MDNRLWLRALLRPNISMRGILRFCAHRYSLAVLIALFLSMPSFAQNPSPSVPTGAQLGRLGSGRGTAVRQIDIDTLNAPTDWSGSDKRNAREVIYEQGDGTKEIAVDPQPDDWSGELGEIVRDQKFLLQYLGQDKTNITVYVGNKRLFTVREQWVDMPMGEPPGLDTMYDHEFHLSPDRRHLFVEQKEMHCVGAGTLYGPVRGGIIGPIRPHGMPFDSAAIHAFVHAMHLHDRGYGTLTRVIHFEGWTRDGVDFSMGLANYWCGSAPGPGEVEYDWTGHFDFHSMRFSHIHVD